MCAIIGSFSKEKIKELYKLNSYRGALSYSLSTFLPAKNIKNYSTADLGILVQDRGEMPDYLIDNLPIGEDSFIIAHSQAPTTESKNIHPAVDGNAMLWHNGIIKQKSLESDQWDTAWLLDLILNYGWSSLSRVDGTFACILFKGGEVFVFRNEISPLYWDKNLNFSSTKFENSISLNANIVYKIDIASKQLVTISCFDTLENPYYIPEIE